MTWSGLWLLARHFSRVIVNVFMEPMRKKRIISEELIMGIFGNIPVLLNINRKLLESLCAAVKRDSDSPDYVNANVGAVLFKFCPFFKMYSNYCKLQTKASSAIRELKKNSKFASFYKSCCKNPETRGMELTVGNRVSVHLQSFLIMPVQRIPRYQLLLKELQKSTPEDHPDYPFISKALECILVVAKECDSAMNGDKETSLKVSIQNSFGSSFQLMKASRKLLKYGPAKWTHMREETPVMVFLFSDLLILSNQFDNELNLHVITKYELCAHFRPFSPSHAELSLPRRHARLRGGGERLRALLPDVFVGGGGEELARVADDGAGGGAEADDRQQVRDLLRPAAPGVLLPLHQVRPRVLRGVLRVHQQPRPEDRQQEHGVSLVSPVQRPRAGTQRGRPATHRGAERERRRGIRAAGVRLQHGDAAGDRTPRGVEGVHARRLPRVLRQREEVAVVLVAS